MRWYAKVLAIGVIGIFLLGYGLTLFAHGGADIVVWAGAGIVAMSAMLLVWRIATTLLHSRA